VAVKIPWQYFTLMVCKGEVGDLIRRELLRPVANADQNRTLGQKRKPPTARRLLRDEAAALDGWTKIH
jgi:hypothetical protein